MLSCCVFYRERLLKAHFEKFPQYFPLYQFSKPFHIFFPRKCLLNTEKDREKFELVVLHIFFGIKCSRKKSYFFSIFSYFGTFLSFTQHLTFFLPAFFSPSGNFLDPCNGRPMHKQVYGIKICSRHRRIKDFFDSNWNLKQR